MIRYMPIKGSPYKHQRDAFEFALSLMLKAWPHELHSRGVSLLMEMGTGKTITSIAIAGALYHAVEIGKVLIVAPLSILGVWEDEFAKFADFSYELIILQGPVERKADTLRHMSGDALQVAVINYESAWRMEAEISKWNPGLIIADEGHKIKTHNTNASKSMHKLGARAQYRLLLTGTLVTNHALDVFSQYKFLNPAIFGQSFYTFRGRYFSMTGYGRHTPVLKKSMEPELTRRIHSIAFRVTKAECLDLPETTDITRFVALEPEAFKTYKSVVKDSYAELAAGEVTVTNVLTKLMRLSQLTGGFIHADDNARLVPISSSKLNALGEIIESVQSEGGKVVVIARFIAEIDAISKMLNGNCIQHAIITGEVKDRSAEVDAFQNNPDVTVFIGQIQTAAMGITLTAASTMVFYSLDYSMSNYEQARARIHRVGQKNACTYIHLIAKSTIDEKVLKALRDKTNLAKVLVDDYKQRGVNPFTF